MLFSDGTYLCWVSNCDLYQTEFDQFGTNYSSLVVNELRTVICAKLFTISLVQRVPLCSLPLIFYNEVSL